MSKKKTYDISMPISGSLYFTVEAESEIEAIELAWEKYENDDYDRVGGIEWFVEEDNRVPGQEVTAEKQVS